MSDPTFRAGFVALIARPNAGKSTLMNRLLGEKLAIVTSRPQTTRNRILGVLHGDDYQLALVDTPGIHKARGGLNKLMVETAWGALLDADLVAVLVDVAGVAKKLEKGQASVHPGDAAIIERLAEAGRPAVLLLNKVDRVEKNVLLPIIAAYQAAMDWEAIYPLSAKTGEGVEGLVPLLVERLPESPPLFPEDTLTDQPERFLAAELVREQVMARTREEVPYGVGIEIVQFDESERDETSRGRKGLVRIEATIVVERDGHKGIVIGKGGKQLKEIGAAARKELEKVLDCKVWLGLHVRVESGWTRTPAGLRKLGYQ